MKSSEFGAGIKYTGGSQLEAKKEQGLMRKLKIVSQMFDNIYNPNNDY